MDSHAPVIDQLMQPTLPSRKAPTSPSHFPQTQPQALQSESYSTVIEQAIATLDRTLLRELLTEADRKVVVKSVAGLAPSKATPLLGLLEGMISDDSQNTQQYCLWLTQLLKRHLGVILTNPEIREVISRIRKFIQRKNQGRATLVKMKGSLSVSQPTERKKYAPRFSYTESRDNTTPQKSEGGQQSWQEWGDEQMMQEME